MDEGDPHGASSRPTLTGAERAELDGLRLRAYSADADILDDPAGLVRLAELEDHVVQERRTEPEPVQTDPASTPVRLDTSAAQLDTTVQSSTTVVSDRFSPRRATTRLHTGLVGAVAALAVALGAGAWWQSGGGTDPAVTSAGRLPADDEQYWPSGEAGYLEFLDSLRDDVLAEVGDVAHRLVRDELRPYGTAYGWSVWAGPSVDGATCLVVAGHASSRISCAGPEAVSARMLSIDVDTGIVRDDQTLEISQGETVRFTLLDDGILSTTHPDDASPAD